MTRRLRLTLIASLALALTSPMPLAQAASPGWKAGDCFAKSDVDADEVILSSRVDCSTPHTVQVTVGGRLPKALASMRYETLRNTKNASVRKALIKAGNSICSGSRVATSIWPAKGPALAKALPRDVARAPWGVWPYVPLQPNEATAEFGTGWVLPDKASFEAGSRDLLCIIYRPGSMGDLTFTGDLRTLETTALADGYRSCQAGPNQDRSVPCSSPHTREVLFSFVTRKFPTVGAKDPITNEMYAPFDAICAKVGRILVGADRTDIEVLADLMSPTAKLGEQANVACSAYLKARNAAGERQDLPGGTVMGLGTKPLS